MLLINQDRDIVVMFNPENDRIKTERVFMNGDFIGINLICEGVLLGTFDSVDEAITEKNHIMNYPFHVHYVRGYSEWED